MIIEGEQPNTTHTHTFSNKQTFNYNDNGGGRSSLSILYDANVIKINARCQICC